MDKISPFAIIGILVAIALGIVIFGGSGTGIYGLALGFLKFSAIIVILFIALIALVVVAIISWQRKRKPTGEAAEQKDNLRVVRDAKGQVTKLRSTTMQIRNPQIRDQSNVVCNSFTKLLGVLKEKPAEVPRLHQFFNYYLPTFAEITKKYRLLEKNDKTTPEVDRNVLKYMCDIETAVEKQRDSLFSNDALDMSVEMEAMQIALNRDGLLGDAKRVNVIQPPNAQDRVILNK